MAKGKGKRKKGKKRLKFSECLADRFGLTIIILLHSVKNMLLYLDYDKCHY